MSNTEMQTILIVSSELDVGEVVTDIMAAYPDRPWRFIYLLEDLKNQAGDDLHREDVFIVRDFARHHDVEEVFSQIAESFSVTRVIPNDEFAVWIAAWANHRWQLPGLTFDMAARFRDKKRMKEIACRAGILTAREISPQAIKRGDVSFPLVMKPRSLAGSVGVKIITDAGQLSAITLAEGDDYRDMDEQQYFFESYNPQPVYQLDAVMLEGRLALLSAGEYIGKPIDYLDEHPLGFFSVAERDLRQVWRPFTEKVLAAFGGPDGVYHIEAFGDGGQGAELLEIAYRPGGAATVEMIAIAWGVDLRFTHLATQLGLEVGRHFAPQGEAWGYMTFPKKHLAREALYVSRLSVPSVENMPTLKMQQLPQLGEVASGEFFCHKDCLGSFVFCGERESVARDLKLIVADYCVTVSPE
ncbi:serine kinase [Erwinia papayae]|uniref:Serine kinase n=1 Tax=Erwinia papayae TaxID=206499 RepID=A0ABV3N4S8_9GAMM